jgi:2-polyprenyl-3-methyl-5-hydroxy-6-metoxy-1,4-benzoquinol methylase
MIDTDKKLICPITNSKKFLNIFSIKRFPIYMGVVSKNYKTESKNMNFKINKKSGTVQIFPRVPLKKLYFKSHGSGKIGKIWNDHHKEFFKFTKKYLNKNILEIGGGHNSISNMFVNLKKNDNIILTSFDPNGRKLKNIKHTLIKDFFNSQNIKKYKIKSDINLIIHSHLIEHIYSPRQFLAKINHLLSNDGYHIFSVPNLKQMIKNGYANAMNFEHPFFLDEKMLDFLLYQSGFKIIRKKYFKSSHSIFYLTKKNKIKKNILPNFFSKNKKIFLDLKNKWFKDIKLLNHLILDKKDIFIFGAHIFSQNLIFNGLDSKKIKYILDNDPNKNNQFLYGTKIQVKNPVILKNYNNPIVILRAGPYNQEIKRNIIKNINNKTKFI